ncbi:hypothetical protein NIIDMKKI_00830 [Mycobacterium kansasii]|uniref:Uncharacterized protein n=1 Tax=Mycobacterium kansasii TaxID=1768 RepID=A0A7G1I1D9_MYCKA|nr:hypothetical protein NIIDMKKI_00830 [Mycobacterium kansasii]
MRSPTRSLPSATKRPAPQAAEKPARGIECVPRASTVNPGRGQLSLSRIFPPLPHTGRLRLTVDAYDSQQIRETGPHRAEQRYSEKTALLRTRQFLLGTRQLEPGTPTQ